MITIMAFLSHFLGGIFLLTGFFLCRSVSSPGSLISQVNGAHQMTLLLAPCFNLAMPFSNVRHDLFFSLLDLYSLGLPLILVALSN